MPRPAVAATESFVVLHTRVRREHLRWLCLRHLDIERPEAMTEAALLALLWTVYRDADTQELRRELHYLSLQSLLTISEQDGLWQVKLTYQGVDLVEYTSHCPPGIGRPVVPE